MIDVNCLVYGKQRNDRILELVGHGTAFTRSQIERVIFWQRDGKRKAQLREPTRILFPAILIVLEYDLKINSKLDFFVAPISEIQRDIYSIILRR